MVAEICDFDISQIDIAHRVSDKGTVPKTVLFNRKADRTNFYRQKNKLFKVQANHIVKPNNVDHSDKVSLPGLERENSYIYMNKNLTSMNRMLLREARKESKKLKYEFPGYTVNGKVRVKKSKSSEYILINSNQDLVKYNLKFSWVNILHFHILLDALVIWHIVFRFVCSSILHGGKIL